MVLLWVLREDEQALYPTRNPPYSPLPDLEKPGVAVRSGGNALADPALGTGGHHAGARGTRGRSPSPSLPGRESWSRGSGLPKERPVFLIKSPNFRKRDLWTHCYAHVYQKSPISTIKEPYITRKRALYSS